MGGGLEVGTVSARNKALSGFLLKSVPVASAPSPRFVFVIGGSLVNKKLSKTCGGSEERPRCQIE